MIQAVNQRIQKAGNSKFFKDTFIVFISNLINRAIGFFVAILIAKNLNVKDYGVLTVLISLTTTISDLANLGLNSSLVRYSALYKTQNEKTKINKLLSSTLINVIIVGAAVIVVTLVASDDISIFFWGREDSIYVVLAGVGVLIALCHSVYCALFQGIANFKALWGFTLVPNIIRILGISILSVSENFNILTVLTVIIFSPLFSFMLNSLFNREYKFSFYFYDRSILKETISFGKWMSLFSIILVIQSKLDVYLLAILTIPSEVAYYDIAQKFVSIVMIFFTSYGTVLTPKIASITNLDEIRMHIIKSKRMSTLLTLLIIFSVILLPLMLLLIFGDKYSNSLIPLGVMLLSLVFYVWTLPYNTSLYAIGKSHVFFIIVSCQLLINLSLSYLLLPNYGALGAAINYAIINVFALVMSLFFFNKYFKK